MCLVAPLQNDIDTYILYIFTWYRLWGCVVYDPKIGAKLANTQNLVP